jgi:hydrogenase maturation protease
MQSEGAEGRVNSAREMVMQLAVRGLLVVGVGNPMRGDDAAGLMLGRALAHVLGVPYVQAEDVPENYLAEMRHTDAANILLVDAVDMRAEAGQISLLEPDRLGSVTISAHKGSLRLLADMLTAEYGKRVLLLGIQPASLGWGEGLSEPVCVAIDAFVQDMVADR